MKLEWNLVFLEISEARSDGKNEMVFEVLVIRYYTMDSMRLVFVSLTSFPLKWRRIEVVTGSFC